jgi:hypothetical protein|nr:MAG TPA: hypothetical protein [Caudoviricetes sp.]DAL31867.1 MAG TPA_asm: hypothetical protein [Caudoviricetes sp.]DAS38689.1 MAG TPA: hypothetical protein [Caudoviricetes sp.]
MAIINTIAIIMVIGAVFVLWAICKLQDKD